MPKIIENLEAKLLEEAWRQIKEGGYSAMTIRSVAAACGVGVGTVYNYFPSKDDLLATYMLSDWKKCVARIASVSETAADPKPVARCIYDQLLEYVRLYQAVLLDQAAAPAFSGSFSRYHSLLRRQLADPLARFCSSAFAAEFIAEALLTWTMAQKPFDEIYDMIGGLFTPAVNN